MEGIVQKNLFARADLGLTTPFEEPRSQTELKLAEIWRHVLGVDAVGTNDDFFELGGDSFEATALAAEIEATFDVRFAPADTISFSTIAHQARAVAHGTSSHTSRLPTHIVAVRRGGSQPALFMVPGAAGFSFFNRVFYDEVGRDRPIYLFQAPGLDGRTKPLKTVEEIATAYVASMREIQAAGPYHISGLCAGTIIGLEMCNQLSKAGQAVARFILLDPQRVPPAIANRYPVKQNAALTILREWLPPALRGTIGSWRRTIAFSREQKKRAKRLQQIQENVRRAGKDQRASLHEGSYSPETMLEASLQLVEALRTHVPRAYEGKATMLISTKGADKTIDSSMSFWRDHLSGIDTQYVNAGHKEMFEAAQIMNTAHFVRNVLETPS